MKKFLIIMCAATFGVGFFVGREWVTGTLNTSLKTSAPAHVAEPGTDQDYTAVFNGPGSIQTTIDQCYSVIVKNPDSIANTNNSFVFNQEGLIEPEGKINVVAQQGTNWLVRYTTPNEKNVGGGYLPSGALVIFSKEMFGKISADQARIELEKKQIAKVIR